MIVCKLLKPSKYASIKLNQSCRFLIHSPMEKNLRITLMDLLGVSSSKLTGILKKYPSLKRVSIENANTAHDHLIQFGISKHEITENPHLLAVLPITIENRYLLLEEMGFTKIDSNLILRYLSIVKKRISLIKSYELLPQNVDLTECIYHYLEKPPLNASPLPKIDDKTTVYEAYMNIREHYLTWRLEFPNRESYLSLLNTYARLKHKSFRIIRENLSILENDVGFTKERLRSHGYLLHSNPTNTKRILSEIQSIGGLPIREVLLKCPKVTMTNVTTIQEIERILKENNIPNESIQQSLMLFTLSSNSIFSRIKELTEVPEFKVLSKNKRVLKLIQHQNKAKQRLEYLHKLKMRNASLSILSAPDAAFEKYVTSGADKTRGDDLVNYLEDNLKVDLRMHLMKHPFWFHVPLIQVSETFEYLSKKFNLNDIKEAAQILLYPKDKVENELKKIRNYPDISRRWVSPIQELNLCLYYLEKPHHFTGDGIWISELS